MPNYISIETASELLKNKKVVAIPTETVYGLAADATSKLAVNKIYKITLLILVVILVVELVDEDVVVLVVELIVEVIIIVELTIFI